MAGDAEPARIRAAGPPRPQCRLRLVAVQLDRRRGLPGVRLLRRRRAPGSGGCDGRVRRGPRRRLDPADARRASGGGGRAGARPRLQRYDAGLGHLGHADLPAGQLDLHRRDRLGGVLLHVPHREGHRPRRAASTPRRASTDDRRKAMRHSHCRCADTPGHVVLRVAGRARGHRHATTGGRPVDRRNARPVGTGTRAGDSRARLRGRRSDTGARHRRQRPPGLRTRAHQPAAERGDDGLAGGPVRRHHAARTRRRPARLLDEAGGHARARADHEARARADREGLARRGHRPTGRRRTRGHPHRADPSAETHSGTTHAAAATRDAHRGHRTGDRPEPQTGGRSNRRCAARTGSTATAAAT